MFYFHKPYVFQYGGKFKTCDILNTLVRTDCKCHESIQFLFEKSRETQTKPKVENDHSPSVSPRFGFYFSYTHIIIIAREKKTKFLFISERCRLVLFYTTSARFSARSTIVLNGSQKVGVTSSSDVFLTLDRVDVGRPTLLFIIGII